MEFWLLERDYRELVQGEHEKLFYIEGPRK